MEWLKIEEKKSGKKSEKIMKTKNVNSDKIGKRKVKSRKEKLKRNYRILWIVTLNCEEKSGEETRYWKLRLGKKV